MMDRKKAMRLVVSVVICQAAGIIGSFFTVPGIAGWYSGLQKPWFTPPNWVFAPVWTTLFLLMGISLYLVWQKRAEGKVTGPAMAAFGVQLVLNVIWSGLFFGLRSPFLALIGIVLLWASILAAIVLFCGVERKAGYLLVPYIAWVTVAASLNYWVWVLNA
jgi:benzodiazapine receptor